MRSRRMTFFLGRKINCVQVEKWRVNFEVHRGQDGERAKVSRVKNRHSKTAMGGKGVGGWVVLA